MRRHHIGVGLVAVAGLVTGACSDAPPSARVLEPDPEVTPYNGPMTTADVDGIGDPELGVAGRALECDHEPYDGGSVDYTNGVAEVRGSPAEALAHMLQFPTMPWPALPAEGYRLERDEGDRAMLSYDVDAETKVAVVVADGVRDYRDDEGWGVERWARCDPAELPEEVTDGSGIGVWQDEQGRRVPVVDIISFQGPEHCDAQEITFLEVAAVEPLVRFVRDTEGIVSGSLTTTFDTVDELPPGVTDTGYSRAGRSLWLGPDREAAYLVDDGDSDDIERWPAETQPIDCA